MSRLWIICKPFAILLGLLLFVTACSSGESVKDFNRGGNLTDDDTIDDDGIDLDDDTLGDDDSDADDSSDDDFLDDDSENDDISDDDSADDDTSDDDIQDDDIADDDIADDDVADDDTIDDDSTDDDSGDDDSGDDDSADDDTVDDDSAEPITLDLVEGCNPFATSDECIFPYPSAFFQAEDPSSPTGVRVNYPDGSLPTPPLVPPFNMDPINTADGVSPAGPILVHFGADVHPDYLTDIHELDESLSPGNPIALFNLETGHRVRFISEMDMNRKEAYPNRYALIIRPMEPMEKGKRHVAVLTKTLRDSNGGEFETPLPFAVLRDNIPVTNEIIEDVRDHYEDIFAFLDAHGYQRENILLAWDFMVASYDYLMGSVLSMRETTLNEVHDTGLGYTIDSIQDDPNEYITRIVEGNFEVPNYLTDDNAFFYDENHHPIRQPENQWFPYTMLIPQKARTLAQPLPLVVFGHGLFGSGRDYLTGWAAGYIQPLIEDTGAIMVATDWIGLSSGDLELILNLVLGDLNKFHIVTDRLQQSLINNITLTELSIGNLSHDPAVKIGDNELIDVNSIYYYGASLGGIMGSSFMSISNRMTRGVFAVPGAVWLNMIPRSINWIPIKIVLDIFYPDPLVQQLGIAFLQTQFDFSDPGNLARLMFYEPLPDAPENRAVILQEAIGDCQVPNMTTEMLARIIGVKQIVPPIYYIPGLETVASPTTESIIGQYYLVDQVMIYSPPEENIPPTQDNGVHFDMIFLPNVLDQVKHFLLTGEIVQYCDGLCDPD